MKIKKLNNNWIKIKQKLEKLLKKRLKNAQAKKGHNTLDTILGKIIAILLLWNPF